MSESTINKGGETGDDPVSSLLSELKSGIESKLKARVFFGDDSNLDLKLLSTGISTFDRALGGGIAFDRLTLITGDSSAGKTLLCLLLLKSAQKQNYTCAWIDAEKSWVPEWPETVGVDTSKVLIVRPKSGEEAFDVARELVRGGIDVLFIDSLFALRPQKEIEDEAGISKPGSLAKLLNTQLTLLVQESTKTSIIAINQIREGIGVMYGNPEFIPGGKGQGFTAWQRIRVRRGAFIEEDGKKVGYRLRIVLEKNKQSTPFTDGEVPFYFTGEVDELAGLIETGIEIGLIKKNKAHYTWGEHKFFGKTKLQAFFKENEDQVTLLKDTIESMDIPEADD